MRAPRGQDKKQDIGHVLGGGSRFRDYDVLKNTFYLSILPSESRFGLPASLRGAPLSFDLFSHPQDMSCFVLPCPALQMILKPHLKGKT